MFIGQFLGILGALVLLRVTTQILTTDQYGQLVLNLTLGVLVCQISLAPVMPGIIRYYTIAVERGDVLRFTKASYRLMGYGVIGTLALTGLVIIASLFSQYKTWIAGILLAIIVTQISSFNSTLTSIQNVARQRGVVALHMAADPWIKIGCVSLVIIASGKSAISVIIAYLAASLLLLVSHLFFLRCLVKKASNTQQAGSTPWLKEMVHYSKPFIFFNLFTWMQANTDRWSLERFTTTQTVGQYAVLTQLGNTPISAAMNFFTSLISPILQHRSGDATDPKRNRSVWRISWQIALFGLGLTVLLFLTALGLHSWVFKIFVAEAYRSQSYLLPWVLLNGGIFATSQLLALKLLSDLHAKCLVAPKIASSLLAVASNVLGAWIWGIEGVVGAGLLFSMVNFAWIGFLARHPKK